MKLFNLILLIVFFTSFSNAQSLDKSDYIQVLGIVQDAGYPHIGCEKDCCKVVKPGDYFVSCLGLIDNTNNKRYLFDATPDMHNQLNLLKKFTNSNLIDGIFLTHAHIGHYSGLMYLGREGLGGNKIKVYALKRMAAFLRNNGPWDQLIKLKNIEIQIISHRNFIKLSKNISVIPIKVPHRDEYSETVGYKIIGKTKKILFIPDIDKWNEWNIDIVDEIKLVDYAFIDGTFYNGLELERDMSEIPHPSVEETIELFLNQPISERNKIYFIHLNHTNPARDPFYEGRIAIEKQGYHFATFGMRFSLE